MSARKPGVSIRKGDAVKKLSTEGALNQMLGIAIDGGLEDLVYLDNVRNEDDLFARCPVTGQIDFEKKLGGMSVKGALEDGEYLTESVYVNPNGDGFRKFDDVAAERVGVSNAKWMDDPEELIWDSALLAQLQAKLVAITHFLNDPSAVDFAGDMSDEDKQNVARRARELAAGLRDEALNKIDSDTAAAEQTQRNSVAKSKDHLMKYAVTTQDAREAGGLTPDEIDEQYQGGA